MTVIVPHTTQRLLEFIVEFLDKYPVLDDSAELELTVWDKEFAEFDGAALRNLLKVGVLSFAYMKVSNFLGCRSLFDAVSAYMGFSLASTKNQQTALEFLGLPQGPTVAEAERLKTIYPSLFF